MDNFWSQAGCWIAVIALSGVILGIVAMFLDYKAKWERKSVTLEKHDQQLQQKEQEHEEKIKKLEEKNGHEQHQIDALNEKVVNLEKFIKDNIITK